MTLSLEAHRNLKNEVDFKDSGVQTKEIFRIDAITGKLMALKKGQNVPSHVTKIKAYLIILEGELLFTMGEEQFKLKAGDVFSIPILQPHSLESLEDVKAILVR